MSKWNACPVIACKNDRCAKRCAAIEDKAREIYLGLYEKEGGLWECVETKDVWRDKAREFFRLDEGTRMVAPSLRD